MSDDTPHHQPRRHRCRHQHIKTHTLYIYNFAPSDSPSKTQSTIQSLSSILQSTPPPSLSSAFSLLHDLEVATQISSLLRHPNSSIGENNLCRWLYDIFQSDNLNLQLVASTSSPSSPASTSLTSPSANPSLVSWPSSSPSTHTRPPHAPASP
ncbi:hypothetical protein FH972_009159 [Carpinus fangiana]|uniref:Uncharacterized protein n=1 Tax=Carpinus fangiana TaxID=176857 RepID=A0A5N6R104_9ROSI|nr:hypothetical protein FH972_009159 [Carpinus fangiana]